MLANIKFQNFWSENLHLNQIFIIFFLDWLNLNDDPALQVSAALALGNFACNEEIGLKVKLL